MLGGASMIIDSHTHYNNNAYKKSFRYLTRNEGGYALAEGDREQLFQELLDANIPYCIEPGVSLQSCEEVLQLCSEYPGRIFPAMGIHPTRSIYEKWADRKKLDAFAKTPGVIAIGECGLDYHYKREEQHRLKQHIWFLYQLDLLKPKIMDKEDIEALREVTRGVWEANSAIVKAFSPERIPKSQKQEYRKNEE